MHPELASKIANNIEDILYIKKAGFDVVKYSFLEEHLEWHFFNLNHSKEALENIKEMANHCSVINKMLIGVVLKSGEVLEITVNVINTLTKSPNLGELPNIKIADELYTGIKNKNFTQNICPSSLILLTESHVNVLKYTLNCKEMYPIFFNKYGELIYNYSDAISKITFNKYGNEPGNLFSNRISLKTNHPLFLKKKLFF